MASLPTPTVRLANSENEERETSSDPSPDNPALGSRSSHSSEHPVVDSTGIYTGADDAVLVMPWPGPATIFAASGRRWIADREGLSVHRRDTWAVGEKWGRHVRVIDVGMRRRHVGAKSPE